MSTAVFEYRRLSGHKKSFVALPASCVLCKILTSYQNAVEVGLASLALGVRRWSRTERDLGRLYGNVSAAETVSNGTHLPDVCGSAPLVRSVANSLACATLSRCTYCWSLETVLKSSCVPATFGKQLPHCTDWSSSLNRANLGSCHSSREQDRHFTQSRWKTLLDCRKHLSSTGFSHTGHVSAVRSTNADTSDLESSFASSASSLESNEAISPRNC